MYGAVKKLVLSAFAATCLTGCFYLDHARFPRANSEHVLVSNYGWYLFDCIPLACGNANENRWFPWVIFRNDVKMDLIQKRFMDYAGDRPMHDLAYITHESVMLEIPGLDIPLPVPYLLCYREIQLSGVLEPKPVPVPEVIPAPEPACEAEGELP